MIKVIKTTKEFLDILSFFDPSENAYLSYGYYKVYLKYNKISDFICFCAVDSLGKYIGLLPLYKKGIAYEIVGYRASNYLGYICNAKDTALVDKEISEHIKINYPGMIIDFYDVNTACTLYKVLAEQPEVVIKIPLYSCPYVDCEQDFETLFKTQISKSKKRAELRKFCKKLELVGKLELINIDDEQTWNKYACYIKDIYSLHAERFAEVYIPEDVCLHKNEKYYTELFESLVKSEKALLSILRVDDVTVSFLYTVVSDGIVMDWMPAFDPAFAKFNLGTVHLIKLLEYLCANPKYRILDFSKGAAVYKSRWAKGETYNYMMVKGYSNSLFSRMKVKFLAAPVILKDKLRKNGQLDRIKDIIVWLKYGKNERKKQLAELDIIESVPDNVDAHAFSYGKIRDLSIASRKVVLNAIYENRRPFVIKVGNQILVKDEENEI